MRPQAHEREIQIATLAARQHGVVARRQLLALGVGPGAIRHRLATGRLHAVHRGVYAVGHEWLGLHGRWLAAVLAYGDGALLSHRSAAALWGLTRSTDHRTDVTAPGGRPGRRAITLHRAALDREDRAVRKGIPLTSVARTLLDLAEVVSGERLARAVEEAERLQLFDLRAINRLIERSNGRRGVKPLSVALAAYHEPTATRSELERRFLTLCRSAGLPSPSLNVWLEGYEVDFLWSQARLVAELDGYEFHRSRAAFERDRLRDTELKLAGYEVIRITSRRLRAEPEAVVSAIRTLLRG
jgi:very-short-patch-repair endonuclease/predicted transcriptional regulator of viral defense system